MVTYSNSLSKFQVRQRSVALLLTTALISLQPLPALAQSGESLAAVKEHALPSIASEAIRAALGKAHRYGEESLLASIVENTRLTPGRAKAVKAEATLLRPDLAQAISRAVATGRHLAELYPSASLPETGGTPSQPTADALPYPGGNPSIPIESLSEYERNYGLSAIRADAALEKGFTGEGVVVGVIDSGIDRRLDGSVHPEFEGRVDARSANYLHWFNTDLDGKDLTMEEFEAGFVREPTDTEDIDGHGTHVSGIVAAGRNGFGMEGVAPGATILSARAIAGAEGEVTVDLGNGDTKTIDIDDLEICGPSVLEGQCELLTGNVDPTIQASRYLAQFSDVKVINMSYGPSVDDDDTSWVIDIQEQRHVLSEAKAMRENLDAGQILVIAASNDGLDAPVVAENPLGGGLYPFIQPKNEGATNSSGDFIYDDEGTGLDLGFTSAEALEEAEKADGIARGRIVVVVALDAYNQIAGYSNKCGVAKEWCVAAPGGDQPSGNDRGIYSTVPRDSYEFESGTSMAAPNVSGAVAVLTEAYPTFSPSEIVEILFMTAEDLGVAGVDAVYGWGLIRLDRALSVGPVGMTGSGVYTVGADNSDTTWIVSFTSDGSLKKEGSGTLAIANGTTFKKGGRVTDGLLAVDGSLTTPTLLIGENGILGGSGLVISDVNISGTLSPGSSPGTLTVAGDVMLNATATTEIDIDGTGTRNGAGNYDRVIVSGKDSIFTAGGTIAPKLRGMSGAATNIFVPQPGELSTFVYAPEGSVEGSFDRLAQPNAGLAEGTRFDVLYWPNALSLAATPQHYGDLDKFGISASKNERALGRAIDAARPAAGVRPEAAFNDGYNTLYSASIDELAAGLPTMTGQLHAEVGTTAVRAVGRFADTIGQRQMDLAVGWLSINSGPYGTGQAWASGGAASTNVGSTGGLAGYDVTANSGAFGIDRQFGGGFAGIAASYEYANVSAAMNGSGHIGTYQGALYGTFDTGAMAFAARAGFSYGDLSTSRPTSLGSYNATASASGHGTGGFIEASAFRTFETSAVTLTPSATLGYRMFRRDDMTEKGSRLGLSVPAATFDETQTTFSLALSKDISLDNGIQLEPLVSAGWRHDFGDITRSSRLGIFGSEFDTAGAEIGADAFVGRLSLTAIAADRFSFEASYQAEFRDNFDSHVISARASLRF